MRSRGWIVAAAVIVVVTACGSTVPPAEQAVARSAELEGTPVEADGGATVDSSASAPATGRSNSTRATGSTTRANRTNSATGANVKPGTPIKIGALTATGAGKYQQSLGFTGAQGDQVAMINAVVGYINSDGGIGGRKIEIVYYDLDPSDEVADSNAAYQAACAAFTEDNKVVAVASILSVVPDSFYQCLENAGVIVVVPGEATSSRFFQRHASSVYMPSSPTYTRLLSATVDALWSRGWLTATSKVGVVGIDTPDSRATVEDGLIPALKRHGLTLSETSYTTTDSASLAGDYPGTVLRFKANNVDRVFFAPGGQPIYFALAAEAQAYRPRYALGSLEYPYLLTQNLPASQLSGSAGLGWMPNFDVGPAQWQKTPTPGRARCAAAVAAARQDLSNGTVLGIASWICDNWFFLREALQRSSTITPVSMRQAVESMGRAFSSATTFATRFEPGRLHDGAATYRLNVFDDGCECHTYVSGDTPLP